MRLTVTVARGVHGSGRLSLANAKNFNDYLKRKRGIMQIDNKDKLCLPRAIVVGRAYIQHFEEKSLSNTNIEVLWVIRSHWLISRAIWRRNCVLMLDSK